MQGKREPRRPLRGHHGGPAYTGPATSNLPLSQQNRIPPGKGVQEVSQHRSGLVEGQIPHHHVGMARQPMGEEITRHHLHVRGKATTQPLLQAGVDLDDCHRTTEARQRHGECAVAWSDLDDGTAGRCNEFDKGGEDSWVGEEILAVFMTTVMKSRHCLLRDDRGTGHAKGHRPAWRPGREQRRDAPAVSGCVDAAEQRRGSTWCPA